MILPIEAVERAQATELRQTDLVGLDGDAQRAHAAERAQRDRFFALDAVARAR